MFECNRINLESDSISYEIRRVRGYAHYCSITSAAFPAFVSPQKQKSTEGVSSLGRPRARSTAILSPGQPCPARLELYSYSSRACLDVHIDTFAGFALFIQGGFFSSSRLRGISPPPFDQEIRHFYRAARDPAYRIPEAHQERRIGHEPGDHKQVQLANCHK